MKSEFEIRAMLAEVRRLEEAAREFGVAATSGATTSRHTLEWVLGERD